MHQENDRCPIGNQHDEKSHSHGNSGSANQKTNGSHQRRNSGSNEFLAKLPSDNGLSVLKEHKDKTDIHNSPEDNITNSNEVSPAFTSKGNKMRTLLEDEDVIRAMLEEARSKNWTSVTISGSQSFCYSVGIIGFGMGLKQVKFSRKSAKENEKVNVIKNNASSDNSTKAINLPKDGETHSNQAKPAFIDNGTQLRTAHENDDVIRAMLEEAKNKNWTAVRISGSDNYIASVKRMGEILGVKVEVKVQSENEDTTDNIKNKNDESGNSTPANNLGSEQHPVNLPNGETSTLESWNKAGAVPAMQEKAADFPKNIKLKGKEKPLLDFSAQAISDFPETQIELPYLTRQNSQDESLQDFFNKFPAPEFLSEKNSNQSKIISPYLEALNEQASSIKSNANGTAPQSSEYALQANANNAYNPRPIPSELSSWSQAGFTEERRAEALERISICRDLPQLITTLDLSDLPLRALPRTLGELSSLQKLQVQGTYLNNIDPVYKLTKGCKVHITGNMTKQLFNEIEARTNDVKYLGPSLLFDVPTSIAKEKKAAADTRNALQQLAETAEQKKLRAHTLAIFKKRCDICYKPANPANNIVLPKMGALQRTSILHEKCLVDQFTTRADENLTLKSRRPFKPPITLDALKNSMSGIEQIRRNKSPYLQVIQSLLAARDTTLSAQQKIDLFIRAANHLNADEHLQIGNRALPKLACLTRALELALQSSPDKIQQVSTLLLEEMPTGTLKFLISGISFNRSQLIDWSKNQNLPMESRVDATAVTLERLMHEQSLSSA